MSKKNRPDRTWKILRPARRCGMIWFATALSFAAIYCGGSGLFEPLPATAKDNSDVVAGDPLPTITRLSESPIIADTSWIIVDYLEI